MKTERYKQGRTAPQPESIDQTTRQALWQQHEAASAKQKVRAQQNLEIIQAYFEFEQRGIPQAEIMVQLAKRYDKGLGKATVWRNRQRVIGQSPDLWLPLMLPKWQGNICRADFTEEAWQWIYDNYFITSKPSLRAVYRWASNVAIRRGWVIPGYDVVKARINAVDHAVKTLRREGQKALFHSYPAQERDYTQLQVHDIWVTDGRKGDVFVRWEDGSVGRPILLAWMDIRSRKVLGWLIGKTESADLVRLSFRHTVESCRALPKEALMDNGRGFASKLITGGIRNRYRFKVKEEDPIGILKMIGVNVMWATPAHGQAKPIESWFGNIAELEKSREFVGAYCGNSSINKPEDFKGKPVPIDLYRRAVAAEIAAYNAGVGHRGDGMDGRSPNQVFDALIENTEVTLPSSEQLRLCLLAVESVKLNKKDHSVEILKNRYWAETLAKLNPSRNYMIRYNPEDATEPVHVYLNEKFICSAPCISKTGFRDQEAAKEHARNRAKFNRSVKDQAKAMTGMQEAESWIPDEPGTDDAPISPAQSRPVVVKLLRIPIQFPVREEEEPDEISLEEFNQAIKSELIRRAASGSE
jgi:transposase InsO family protein